jgi:hypothetical protein
MGIAVTKVVKAQGPNALHQESVMSIQIMNLESVIIYPIQVLGTGPRERNRACADHRLLDQELCALADRGR